MILVASLPNLGAETTEEDDVEIDPEDDVSESLVFTRKDDDIKVKVTSDIPVNVYIIRSEDYVGSSFDKDYSKAKYSKEGILY